MSVGFFLKDKNKATTYINTVVAFKGKYYKRSTGESISARHWRDGAQRCKETGFSSGRRINKWLNEIFVATAQACDYFVEKREIPFSGPFWERVDFFLTGGKTVTEVLFLDYFQQYIERYQNVRATETVKKYITTLNKLRTFEESRKLRLKFENIDIFFYRDFEKFLYAIKRKDSAIPYSLNYFGSLVKCIMVVYREARDTDGLHNLNGTAHRDFKATQRTADTVYLTVDELMRIHRLKLTPELVIEHFPNTDTRSQNMDRHLASLNITRNKFLIGAFTGLRVSDFNRLSSVNIQDDRIRIRTQKTDASAVIPIHWVIREILDGGFDIATPLSEQKINKHIKEVSKMAGIDTPIEVVYHAGGKRVTEVLPKWQLITNHTARRSGITNMVKAGVPITSAMKISTHTTVKSFLAYLKFSLDENADILANSDFFKNPKSGE